MSQVTAKKSSGLLLTLAFLIAPTLLFAQHEAGLRLSLGVPQGEFADNAEDPGFGLGGHYAYAATPNLSFGAGLNYLLYGTEKRRISIPLVEDPDLVTSNNILGFFMLAQINIIDGPATPYLEGRLGGLYLWTESKLEDADWIDDDDISETVNYSDLTLQYGFGGGFRIELSKGDGKNRPSILLDLKATYVSGQEAEYLTEGDIELVNDRAVFDPSTSDVDLMLFELGVVLSF